MWISRGIFIALAASALIADLGQYEPWAWAAVVAVVAYNFGLVDSYGELAKARLELAEMEERMAGRGRALEAANAESARRWARADGLEQSNAYLRGEASAARDAAVASQAEFDALSAECEQLRGMVGRPHLPHGLEVKMFPREGARKAGLFVYVRDRSRLIYADETTEETSAESAGQV